MHPTLTFPTDLDLKRFLETYWQKRPALLRNAVATEFLTFPAEELAGLACEDGVESRLIQQTENNKWQLELGPLEEQAFEGLPESNWTLLVQDVDKHVPDVARLLEAFSFLPDWRLDDIMISYAADEGGVGPHTDNYDVFLVQAQGQRRWRLSESDYGDDDLLPDCPLRVLRHFETSEDWLLNPGDVLYLPPRLGHWGTAVGECMTWSIGMRGPSQDELLDAWLQFRCESSPSEYFHDNLAPGRKSPALILGSELDQARTLMQDLLPRDDDHFRRWFGSFVTEPKPDFEVEPLQHPVRPDWLQSQVSEGAVLIRHPWIRIACVDLDTGPALCAQGECFVAAPELQAALQCIAEQRLLLPEVLLALEPQSELWAWLCQLFNRGLLLIDE